MKKQQGVPAVFYYIIYTKFWTLPFVSLVIVEVFVVLWYT